MPMTLPLKLLVYPSILAGLAYCVAVAVAIGRLMP
jgi:hypothetical protein